MRYLLRVINLFADSCLAWFTPLWRRRGHEATSLISRYIHHYGSVAKPELLEDLRRMRARFREALLYWRKDELLRLTQEVEETYVGKLAGFRRHAVVEIVESLFVITVVFLGIRTYFVQPFRIPTNSMWPSLNGIVVHPVEEFPSWPERVWDALTLGSSYVNVKADADKCIENVEDRRKLILFTETVLTFDDHSQVTIPAASGTVMQYLREQGKVRESAQGMCFVPYKAGETIMRARVDAGDMVLVNRVAYHFRSPRRGETFVFDTRGINTSPSSSASLREQSGGTHFIKRLCGLPGDSIRIESPNLIINDRVADEPGIARVEAAQPPYNATGYVALNPYRNAMTYLTLGRTVTLSEASAQRPWMKEYLALGDNTRNSLDSRYWGPVRQFNILGPAAFTLWPFTRHWGAID